MARLPRLIVPGVPVHIVQRGNDRQACFFDEPDYHAYLHWLQEAASLYSVAIHAYVLMTNHVHLLATPETTEGASNMMQYLGRYFVNYVNRVYKRSGTLWEGRFKSCLIDSERYLMAAYRYIEQNTVRARIVPSIEDYRWSSYRTNSGLERSALITPCAVWLALGDTATERGNAHRQYHE